MQHANKEVTHLS
jgi:hypothetical protein